MSLNDGPRGRTAVVFGARRLGKAIAIHLAEADWIVTAASRTPETIESLSEERPDITGLVAELGAAGAARDVLADAAGRSGSIDLVVNAIADPQVVGAAQSSDGDVQAPIGEIILPLHNTIAATLALLRGQQSGTFIQITGGLALRPRRGSAAWAAIAHAVRALIESSIAEARDDNVHVALLAINGLIDSDVNAPLLRGKPPGASIEERDVTDAVDYLVAQRDRRAWTHSLVLTAPLAPWND